MALCNPYGIHLIISMEKLRLTAYPDQNKPPVWTLGYGHTLGITAGMSCTVDQAVEWLHTDLGGVEHALTNLIPAVNTNQFSACCSLAFNIGIEAFQTSSVLVAIGEGNFETAARDFLLWNKVTIDGLKVISSGLVARRQLEKDLFLSPLLAA